MDEQTVYMLLIRSKHLIHTAENIPRAMIAHIPAISLFLKP